MIVAKDVSHINIFGDEMIYYISVDCDYKRLTNKAKKIDQESFRDDCFVVKVMFDEDGLQVLNEDGESELYYTDSYGNNIGLGYMLKDKEKMNVLKVCRKDMLKELLKETEKNYGLI